jgi:transcriptional regulator with XRE-family HTH domain
MARKSKEPSEVSTASATAQILAANLAGLMAAHSELNSNPKLAKKTELSTGTISRLRNSDVDANLDTLERLARAFQVDPWQLLVPGMDPKNVPTLQPTSEAERRLYERIREMAKEIKEG